jgi:putative tryptophan/tyrosine transport system substrate-binding protein
MQIVQLKRREFITLLGGVAAWPLVAGAQQTSVPVIGYLETATTSHRIEFLTAFRQGLNETGFVEGRNVLIEFRSSDGHAERLPTLAAGLVSRQAAVILAAGGAASALAARAASSTIPIVVVFGADPVKLGLIESLSRPGGNVTGATFMGSELGSKRIDLIQQIASSAKVIAFLYQPDDRMAEDQQNEVLAAGNAQGLQIVIIGVRSDRDFEGAFTSLTERKADALIVGAFPLFANNHARLIGLSAHYKIPTIYPNRDYTAMDGLMSYGARDTDSFRIGGTYVRQILKGAKPADLPFQLPTKYELTINLKAARAFGLEITPMLLALADEVIE